MGGQVWAGVANNYGQEISETNMWGEATAVVRKRTIREKKCKICLFTSIVLGSYKPAQNRKENSGEIES